MKLTLGISPCPNDTFIFDAMIHGRIDTEGLTFDVIMKDVEALNQSAFNKELDITKLSFFAFAHLVDSYALLESGSALGNGVGPILITKDNEVKNPINQLKIAIPGKYTTANFLLSLAYPYVTDKKEMVFHEIENAIISGEVDAGVIIHENRFTYQQKGLVKIMDLGEYWEITTGMPIPLGGIAVRRDILKEIQQKLERVLQRSVRYAIENPLASSDFVAQYAQEMDTQICQQHIDLYVNKYTEMLGEDGRKAVELLFKISIDKKIIPDYTSKIFVN